MIANPFIAYGFSRIEWPGRDKVFYIVLATVFIPFPVLIVALFDIFATLGWVNTLPAADRAHSSSVHAFWIFLMRQFLMQIPRISPMRPGSTGRSEFAILFRSSCLWPCRPSASSASSPALHAWNDFFGPLIYLQDAEKYTLSIGLNFFHSAARHPVQPADGGVDAHRPAGDRHLLPLPACFVEGVTLGSIK